MWNSFNSVYITRQLKIYMQKNIKNASLNRILRFKYFDLIKKQYAENIFLAYGQVKRLKFNFSFFQHPDPCLFFFAGRGKKKSRCFRKSRRRFRFRVCLVETLNYTTNYYLILLISFLLLYITYYKFCFTYMREIFKGPLLSNFKQV